MYGCLIVINNVEMIVSVLLIILGGIDWFWLMGSEKLFGFILYLLFGYVICFG